MPFSINDAAHICYGLQPKKERKLTYSDFIELDGQRWILFTELPMREIAKALDDGDEAEAGRLIGEVFKSQLDAYLDESYDPSLDEKLDDPRHGQAYLINRGL